MIKAVIFDMDGLMIDSEAVGIKILEETMKSYPYEYNSNLALSVIGTNQKNARRVFLNHYGQDFPYDEIREKEISLVEEFYEKNNVPLKPGLLELLEYLQKQKIRIGLATSTYRHRAESLLKKAGVWSYFEVSVCGDEVAESKPNPEIYQKAIQSLEVEASRALVLEDSENGLRAAHDAGIPTIFIKDIVSPAEDVLDKVTHKALTLHDVIHYIEEKLIR